MAPTNAELRAENEALRAEIERLRAQGGRATEPAPLRPSFVMSEGVRQELEQSGRATDPYTGQVWETDDNGEPRLITDEPGVRVGRDADREPFSTPADDPAGQ